MPCRERPAGAVVIPQWPGNEKRTEQDLDGALPCYVTVGPISRQGRARQGRSLQQFVLTGSGKTVPLGGMGEGTLATKTGPPGDGAHGMERGAESTARSGQPIDHMYREMQVQASKQVAQLAT
jgi:hypothetical protein